MTVGDKAFFYQYVPSWVNLQRLLFMMVTQMDSDMEWIRSRPKMTEKQWNVYRRPISLVLNIGLIVNHYQRAMWYLLSYENMPQISFVIGVDDITT